jgi:hypothetical protein
MPTAARRAPKKPAKGATSTLAKADKALSAAKQVSSAARQRAESLLAEIARRKQRIAEDFYDIGLSLKELLNKKLHLPLGYKSFADMLRARAVMSLAQANKLIQLVSTVPRDQALAYGQEKAIALVGYARATPELDTPQSLFEKGVLAGGKPIADASVRELREGAKRVRKVEGKSKPKSATVRAAEDEAKAMRAWLRARGARTATVEPIQRDGSGWLRIELPASAAARLRA